MPASIGTDPIVKEVRVQASPETVWGFFTEPEKMTRWLCTAATVDPRPGGVNNMTHTSDDGVDYHLESRFVEVEPPHRLLFTWKFASGTPEGVRAWLLFCCEAFEAGAREAKSISDAAS